MYFIRGAYKSWIVLGAGIGAWILVFFFIWHIEEKKQLLRSSQASVARLESERTSSLQLVSMARDTKDVRSRLDALVRVEVVSMVDTIDTVGKDAGVFIQIGQAIPESAKNGPLRSVTFQMSAEGSFAALSRAIALFETLPIPSSVEQVRFTYTGGSDSGAKGRWHMSARLRIMTTADIPS